MDSSVISSTVIYFAAVIVFGAVGILLMLLKGIPRAVRAAALAVSAAVLFSAVLLANAAIFEGSMTKNAGTLLTVLALLLNIAVCVLGGRSVFARESVGASSPSYTPPRPATCPKCGKPVRENDAFCVNCGFRL